MLDLDDLGAEIGQLLGTQRPGDDPGEVEHSNAIERGPDRSGVGWHHKTADAMSLS